jgi:hypothetical protein
MSSLFDRSLSRYYTFFHPLTEGGTKNVMLEIIPGHKFDNMIFAPFDCKVTLESSASSYYFEDGDKWIRFSCSSGSSIKTGEYKAGDLVGVLCGWITMQSWDDGMLDRIATSTGWQTNSNPSGEGLCVLWQQQLNDGTGYVGNITEKQLAPGTEYIPETPADATSNGQKWVGWSTTWPNYTPYDGVIPDTPFFQLFGIWEATESTYEFTYNFDIQSGETDIVKNQHNHKQTIKRPRGTYCPAFCIPDVYEAGPYYIQLGTCSGNGGASPSTSFYSRLVLAPNPETLDLGKFYFAKMKVMTDILHDKYIIVTEETVNPYPEGRNLLFGHNVFALKLGWIHSVDDDYKNYFGCYWYVSGSYGGKKKPIIPILTALSSQYTDGASFFNFIDYFTY